MRLFTTFLTFALVIIGISGISQTVIPEYLMTNAEVEDCDGILFDSGGEDQTYGTDEDFTFVINSGAPMTLTFLEDICIEQGFDSLMIYDGPDIFSPVLANISGQNFTPAPIDVPGGVVTLRFESDGNTSYCGFEILWDSQALEPTPPAMSLASMPTCGSNVIDVNFTLPLTCDAVSPDSILVTGDGIIPINDAFILCDGETGNAAQIILDEPFEYNCNYSIEMTIGVADACDSLWYFAVGTSFLFDDCDLNGNLSAEETELCSGNCTNLLVNVPSCFELDYEWTPALPNGPGPHEVCLEETTTYSVVVTENETSHTVTLDVTIDVIQASILYPDTTLCQSEPGFILENSGSDGYYWGPGIQEEPFGFFEPDSANAGQNIIYYVEGDACYDSVLIDITPIDAGLVFAACPGSDPFFLGGEPAGGIWSGPFVDINGFFDPSTTGSYTVTYLVNGCLDEKIINVDDIAGTFDLDTLCQSVWPDTLAFSPLGGTWSGPGIIDPLYGIFAPEEVDPGTYDLLYEVSGCDQIFTITIKEIDTGNRVKTSCPSQAPYIPYPNFSPTGGYWEGLGITDIETGMYDPGSVPDDQWTSLIYYAPNGCTDTIFYYNRFTNIELDTGYVCVNDNIIPLDNDNVGNRPWNGVWTGQGVTNPDNNYYEFNPALAGPGEHWLTYDLNDCYDTLLVVVYPTELNIESYSICSNIDPFILDDNVPAGGTWSGNGIIDSEVGLFDPGLADIGDFYVYWHNPAGCNDSIFIELEALLDAEINGLEEIYCSIDETFFPELIPEGGILTGGTEEFGFNPFEAGEGVHTLIYTYTGLNCSSSDTITIEVFPSIETELSVEDDLICPGQGTSISITAIGGDPGSNLVFEWSDDLLPLSTNNVSPESSQYFYVTTIDGCSDPSLDSIFIEVLPPIIPSVALSDTVCFGEDGFANATVLTEGNFDIYWEGSPSVSGPQVDGVAGGIYELQISDVDNGCTFDSLVIIPSYTAITALFSVNPNVECIPFEDQPVYLIDLSQHGQTGFWDLDNDNIEPYVQGENPSITYDVAGNYSLYLYIENEGGCPDSIQKDICILDPSRLFIPDIFSPNDDGANDVLFVRGQGITDFSFRIFDRWGEMIFESSDLAIGWDGNFRGMPVPQGNYVYKVFVRMNDGTNDEITGDVILVR